MPITCMYIVLTVEIKTGESLLKRLERKKEFKAFEDKNNEITPLLKIFYQYTLYFHVLVHITFFF